MAKANWHKLNLPIITYTPDESKLTPCGTGTWILEDDLIYQHPAYQTVNAIIPILRVFAFRHPGYGPHRDYYVDTDGVRKTAGFGINFTLQGAGTLYWYNDAPPKPDGTPPIDSCSDFRWTLLNVSKRHGVQVDIAPRFVISFRNHTINYEQAEKLLAPYFL